ncbi:hypothetical protein RMATCC62417_03357 [Rhizopus microsporus]|nr:hypothetical protein RMATCC62417_03357 [Rhizopus microsporus]
MRFFLGELFVSVVNLISSSHVQKVGFLWGVFSGLIVNNTSSAEWSTFKGPGCTSAIHYVVDSPMRAGKPTSTIVIGIGYGLTIGSTAPPCMPGVTPLV